MRRLREHHITWTRLVIISFAADLPDFEAAVERLLVNQAEIGDAIKPFYGDAAGEALSTLLREHITVAADVLAGAKSGDAAAFDAANRSGTGMAKRSPTSWRRPTPTTGRATRCAR